MGMVDKLNIEAMVWGVGGVILSVGPGFESEGDSV